MYPLKPSAQLAVPLHTTWDLSPMLMQQQLAALKQVTTGWEWQKNHSILLNGHVPTKQVFGSLVARRGSLMFILAFYVDSVNRGFFPN